MSDAITEIAVESNQANLERINLALSQGAIARARQLINEDLAAPDIAHLYPRFLPSNGPFSGT